MEKRQKKEIRSKMVVLRLNATEYSILRRLVNESTEKNTSSYLRKVAQGKPVIIKYRNQAADELLAVMLQLKKELNAAGNNFNQAVHKLHLLDKIPEFRVWINQYGEGYKTLLETTAAVQQRMQQLYDIWSPGSVHPGV